MFGETIKFGPLTLLERELILFASGLLAWATYRFVEIPFRFGRPSPRKMVGLGAGMAMIAIAGLIVVWERGFEFRLPPEIRAMASVRTESFKWRFHECLLDLGKETEFSNTCVEGDRRPLVLIWGDSTAGALLPGLRKAQQTRNFAHRAAHLQLLHSGAWRHCGRAELPGHQRQGFCAHPADQA